MPGCHRSAWQTPAAQDLLSYCTSCCVLPEDQSSTQRQYQKRIIACTSEGADVDGASATCAASSSACAARADAARMAARPSNSRRGTINVSSCEVHWLVPCLLTWHMTGLMALLLCACELLEELGQVGLPNSAFISALGCEENNVVPRNKWASICLLSFALSARIRMAYLGIYQKHWQI